MKTPQDFISETQIKFTSKAIEEAFYRVIKKAQKEAFNEALDLAAQKVEFAIFDCNGKRLKYGHYKIRDVSNISLDIASILILKI